MKTNFSSYRNKLKRKKYLISQTIQAINILQNYSSEEIIQFIKNANGFSREHFLLAENGKKIFYHQLELDKIKTILIDELLEDSKTPELYLANIIKILCSTPTKEGIVNEIIQQCLNKQMKLTYDYRHYDIKIYLSLIIKRQMVSLTISSSGIYVETSATTSFFTSFEDDKYFQFNRNRNKIINNVLWCVDQFIKGKPYVSN